MNAFTVAAASVLGVVALLETWVQCSRAPHFRKELSGCSERDARSSADDLVGGEEQGMLARWRGRNFRLSLDDGGALKPMDFGAVRSYSYWATALAGSILLCVVMLQGA